MSLLNVVIVGGGLAGLTSALHLTQSGLGVTLIEKNPYPRHKVCGEYISNEVLPYLDYLGVDPFKFGAKKIDNFELSAVQGKSVFAELPLGGFSISRFQLDHLLYKKAVKNGVTVIQDSVTDIDFTDNRFQIRLKNHPLLEAVFVIGAYGKRSNLDQKMGRKFLKSKAPYLAVKAHYKGDYPENLVGLHHFYGGYCGVSNVENNNLNVCYIAEYAQFKKYKNIKEFEEKVLFKNKELKSIFQHSKLLFDKPLSISQISFASKPLIEDHVIMSGDSAGMIHPLCGNGMSMAIYSAKMISELLIQYFDGSIDRTTVELKYVAQWEKEFKLRIQTGKLLSRMFRMKSLTLFSLNILKKYPKLIKYIIRMTHGKPIVVV